MNKRRKEQRTQCVIRRPAYRLEFFVLDPVFINTFLSYNSKELKNGLILAYQSVLTFVISSKKPITQQLQQGQLRWSR